MRRFIAGVLVVLGFATAPAAGSAEGGATHWTFHGDCRFSGSVRFTPPLTGTPRPGRGIADAVGTCTGTLSGHGTTTPINNATARYWATDSSDRMDCQGGQAPGRGRLRIGHAVLPFRLVETRAAAVAALQLSAPAWSAIAAAHTSTTADPVAVAAACAGSGLRRSPLDITLHTYQPTGQASAGSFAR